MVLGHDEIHVLKHRRRGGLNDRGGDKNHRELDKVTEE